MVGTTLEITFLTRNAENAGIGKINAPKMMPPLGKETVVLQNVLRKQNGCPLLVALRSLMARCPLLVVCLLAWPKPRKQDRWLVYVVLSKLVEGLSEAGYARMYRLCSSVQNARLVSTKSSGIAESSS